MTARFRLLHYLPDPFSELRIPFAAFVDSGGGSSAFARAQHLPGPGCVGGLRASETLLTLVDFVRRADSLESLLPSLGPQAVLGDRWLSVPADVSDPVAWVESNILPRKASKDESKESTPRAPKRDIVGYKFFETWKVDRFIKKRWDPQMIPGVHRQSAKPISHYVPGSDELLLMEPLIASRANFEKELTEISQSFLAWHQLFALRNSKQKPRFSAYVFGAPKYIEEARRVLGASTDEVIGVEDGLERSRFLAHIRDVGMSGVRQGTLPDVH